MAMALCLLCISAVAHAGEFKEWLRQANGEHLQQEGFQLVDPKGDAFLIRKLDQVPRKLVEALVKKSYPQSEADEERKLAALEATQDAEAVSAVPLQTAAIPPQEPVGDLGSTMEKGPDGQPKFTVGRAKAINVERLTNKVRQIMQTYADKITPTIGEEHEWSPEAKRYLLWGFWQRIGWFITGKTKEFPSPLFLRSKLFLLLACGWTSRYAVTGHEQELRDWVMAQKERSIQIHDLFRASYLLNRGNLYLTMLTAENVLAGDPYRADRDKDPLQMKLAYIRNDSLPYGDNYGCWYHFFGIGLYGTIRAPVVARAVAEIETCGSVFLEAHDWQEDYANRYGAIFGRKLNRLVTKDLWKKPLTAQDRTDYMTFVPVTPKQPVTPQQK